MPGSPLNSDSRPRPWRASSIAEWTWVSCSSRPTIFRRRAKAFIIPMPATQLNSPLEPLTADSAGSDFLFFLVKPSVSTAIGGSAWGFPRVIGEVVRAAPAGGYRGSDEPPHQAHQVL